MSALDTVIRQTRIGTWKPLFPPTILSLATFFLYSFYALTRQRQMITGFDLGIFSQAVSGYAEFSAPLSPIKGLGFNLLGDHFHPILAVLAPLWWLHPGPETLLVAQAGLVALSIFPIYAMCARHLGKKPGLILAAAYALSWPIQGLIDYDFHEIAFAIPILAYAINFYDQRKNKAAVAVAALLIFVREDLFLLLAAFAILALIQRRWKPSLAYAFLACIGYILALVILIPHFSPTGIYTYAAKNDPMTALTTLLTNPGERLTTLLLLLASYGFVSLASPYFILAVPLIAVRFLSTRESLWNIDFHYSAPLAPILVLAAADAITRISRRINVSPPTRQRLASALAIYSVAFVLLGFILSFNLSPLQRLVTGEAYELPPRVHNAQQIINLVPKNICVEADDLLIPQLLSERTVGDIQRPSGHATAIVIDISRKGLPNYDPFAYLRSATRDGYTVTSQSGSIVLLERDIPIDPRCRTSSP